MQNFSDSADTVAERKYSTGQKLVFESLLESFQNNEALSMSVLKTLLVS